MTATQHVPEPVSLDDTSLREPFDLRHEARQHDSGMPGPAFAEFAAAARESTENVQEHWIVRAPDGTALGTYRFRLPQLDNRHLADLSLVVHPAARGRGVGQALLRHAVERCAARERSVIWTYAARPATATGPDRATRFATSAGFRAVLQEVQQSLHLAEVDDAAVARLGEETAARSPAYEVLGWSGRCPDDLVEGYAGLNAALMTEAPTGGLDLEPEVWDAPRIRHREATFEEQGLTVHATVARVTGGGPVVAYTDVAVARDDPANAMQWNTLVAPEHRGHRLGARVKLANLHRIRRHAPEVREVWTWNAEENAHMIAINEMIGFRPVQRATNWQLDISREASR